MAVGGQVVSERANNNIIALPQICVRSGSGCSESIMEVTPFEIGVYINVKTKCITLR